MTLAPRPTDATLSVTKAARLLGVHPNTVRAWSDQGRLRFYRINPRGDRRYRLSDLQRFLAKAEAKPEPSRRHRGLGGIARPVAPSIGADIVELRTRPTGRPSTDQVPLSLPITALRSVPTSPARTRLESDVLAHLAELVSRDSEPDAVMRAAVEHLCDRTGHALVAILERRAGRLVPRSARGVGAERIGTLRDSQGLPGRALRAIGAVAETARAGSDWLTGPASLLECRIAAAIDAGGEVWGVLLVADEGGKAPQEWASFVAEVARWIGVALHAGRLRAESLAHRRRAEALGEIALDIGSKLDVDRTLAGVVEHARVLFGADRTAVSVGSPDGRIIAQASRGLSSDWLATLQGASPPSLFVMSASEQRPAFATHYREDPRARAHRAAVLAEGFDTICAAPLLDDGRPLGLLTIYHDRPHPWNVEELRALTAFAANAASAIRNAAEFTRMETWAAQLQSIQQLGAQLSRLTTEREIGAAICNELETLINFHNVRVYRLRENGWLVPVAMRGLVGEFRDETPDQLRVRIGEGITGWVARNKIPQYLGDAASDPRAVTIVGTEDDLAESMLLAPMIYEDEVLGVIVLSKLGLYQFADDDLRLLVIYASLAAQAIAHAGTSERLRAKSTQLERRLDGQRSLLAITESILATLDTREILEQVVDRLSAVVRLDTISIELLDVEAGVLRPILARGLHAAEYLEPWQPGEEGLATWVVARGEPQLVTDKLRDPRVHQFETTGPLEGSLICVPLRGPDGALGAVSLERLGAEDRFDEDDFELVQLFVAQVSIALRNAAAFRVKEIEAKTDQVTGLLNAGAFRAWLQEPARPDAQLGLLMLDLDNFKDVNETMGHEAGTELLRQIAVAITQASRDSDRVFRYGGDEFTVVVSVADSAGRRQPGGASAAAMAVAYRIQDALHALAGAHVPGGRAPVSASIGVAAYPADGATHAEILLAADRACFVAKRRGRALIATAAEGLALAADFTLSEPTPMDPVAPPAD